MSHLSHALTDYYSREGKKVVFRNGQSLNQFALAMWERLGLQQVDASVLSRVLKGERLFTGPQVKVFCSLLLLSKKEESYLLGCLQEDYDSRLHVYTGTTRLSSSLTKEVIVELTKGSFDTFYQGNYDELEKKYDFVQQLVDAYSSHSGNNTRAASEAIGLNMYLKGRAIANGELPSRVIGRIYPIFNKLLKLSKATNSRLLHGYAYVLLCTAYYLAGGYSESSRKQRFYSTSIKLAKEAVSTLPPTDHEALFALRSMAASACYIHDQETMLYVLKTSRSIFPKQPKENYINTLLLSMTLSKGMAAFNMQRPFEIQEFALNHFKRSLSNTGVYEVSAIKEEVETLLILGTEDKYYIHEKLKEGLGLTGEYNFSRQKKYFNKLLRVL